jgi:cytochrome c oxidase cbb3-type subunit III
MAGVKEKDELTGVETTGHEWDGIRELNNPLPRWWLILLWASIAWAVVYWILMPAWPLWNSYTPGIRGHSDRRNVAAEVSALQQARAPMFAQLEAAGIEAAMKDEALLEFAMQAGRSAFGDNCATCHGAGGQGAKGYPALVDDVWLWGGTLKDIRHTLDVGIRSTHDDTRFSQMPAYGRDELLKPAEIADVAQYVVRLSGRQADAGAAARGAVVFATNCASCHGADGKGDRTQGAPNLTDADWLYGGTVQDITYQIQEGRGGVMPSWQARLSKPTLDALAIYVHSLGGGEAAPPPAPVVAPAAAPAAAPAPAAPAAATAG